MNYSEKASENAPKTIFLKLSRRSEYGRSEAAFYNLVGSSMPANIVPVCYQAEDDFLLLEDATDRYRTFDWDSLSLDSFRIASNMALDTLVRMQSQIYKQSELQKPTKNPYAYTKHLFQK